MSTLERILEIVNLDWKELCVRHYFTYKNDISYELHKISMGNEEDSISHENYQHIVSLANKLINDEKKSILDYKEADDRVSSIYTWEKANLEVPPIKKIIPQVFSDQTKDVKRGNYSNFDFHITVVDNEDATIIFFKKVHPASIVKPKGAVIFKDKSFVRPKKPYFRVPKGFDFFVYKGTLYINNSEIFEKAFAITDYLMSSVQNHIDHLVAQGFLSRDSQIIVKDFCQNLEKFRKSFTRSIVLMRYKESKYSKDIILNEAVTNPNYKDIFKFDSNGAIQVNNKEEFKTFLSFLNDDILKNGLGDEYEVLAKNRIK